MRLQNFLIDTPLYEEINTDQDYAYDAETGETIELETIIDELDKPDKTIEAYCPQCKNNSFLINQMGLRNIDKPLRQIVILVPIFIQIEFKCQRCNSRFHFDLLLTPHNFEYLTLMKVGQHPSFADIKIAAAKKYSKALDKPYFSELNKAIGLAAHGIGTGAFVYLRRIFETLVDEAVTDAVGSGQLKPEDLQGKRVTERIGMVGDALPPILVENKAALYNVLSKGVHELSDDECRAHFPLMKTMIELILDQKLAAQEKEKAEREARAELARLNAAMK
ncbi:hypothetical protein [Desulfocurvus sp. DL9XJH121]